MKTKIVNVFYHGKKCSFSADCVSGFGFISGLMFRLSTISPLLFQFKRKTNTAIHSFFVFFPFLAIWLDEKFKVLEWKIVKPWSFHIKPKEKYFFLVEVPFNAKYEKIISFFVGKTEKFKY